MTDLFEVPVENLFRPHTYRAIDETQPVRAFRTATGGCRIENAAIIAPFHDWCSDTTASQGIASAQASCASTAMTPPSDDEVA